MRNDPIVEIVREPLFRPTCYHERCCVVYRLASGRLRCTRRPWWQCQNGDQPHAHDFEPVLERH